MTLPRTIFHPVAHHFDGQIDALWLAAWSAYLHLNWLGMAPGAVERKPHSVLRWNAKRVSLLREMTEYLDRMDRLLRCAEPERVLVMPQTSRHYPDIFREAPLPCPCCDQAGISVGWLLFLLHDSRERLRLHSWEAQDELRRAQLVLGGLSPLQCAANLR